MFCNNDHSPAFKEFLELLGDTVTLKGFDKYVYDWGTRDSYHKQYCNSAEYILERLPLITRDTGKCWVWLHRTEKVHRPIQICVTFIAKLPTSLKYITITQFLF